MQEQGQSMRSPLLEKEGASETTWDELTIAPIPCPSAPLRGKEVEKTGSKVEPGKKGGVGGEGVFKLTILL